MELRFHVRALRAGGFDVYYWIRRLARSTYQTDPIFCPTAAEVIRYIRTGRKWFQAEKGEMKIYTSREE